MKPDPRILLKTQANQLFPHSRTKHRSGTNHLELVQVVAQLGHLDPEVLALAHSQDELLHLGALVHGAAGHVVPVIEDALGESLSGDLLTEGLDLDERGALTRVLLEHAAT